MFSVVCMLPFLKQYYFRIPSLYCHKLFPYSDTVTKCDNVWTNIAGGAKNTVEVRRISTTAGENSCFIYYIPKNKKETTSRQLYSCSYVVSLSNYAAAVATTGRIIG